MFFPWSRGNASEGKHKPSAHGNGNKNANCNLDEDNRDHNKAVKRGSGLREHHNSTWTTSKSQDNRNNKNHEIIELSDDEVVRTTPTHRLNDMQGFVEDVYDGARESDDDYGEGAIEVDDDVDEDDDEDEDEDDDDEYDDNQISNWLEERDEPTIVETKVKVEIPLPDDEFIRNNRDAFYALSEVEDLNFLNMSLSMQIELIKSLVMLYFRPGDSIFEEGGPCLEMYFVIATEATVEEAEVEVWKVIDGRPKSITRLVRGQHFGQKFFLTMRHRSRAASVRIPVDCPCNVKIGKLIPEKFYIWEGFRNTLLIKAVPLIQLLPREERLRIIDKIVVKEYSDGEYIIRQGDIGNEFFIIREGSVRVIDEMKFAKPVTLVTLREGHFFGEMSLVTEEPRVASVVSIGNCICLCLTKSTFTAALSESSFSSVLSKVLQERQKLREARQNRATNPSPHNSSFSESTGGSCRSSDISPSIMTRTTDGMSGRRRRFSNTQSKSNLTSAGSFTSNTDLLDCIENDLSGDEGVTITSHVKVKKLKTGTMLVNKYRIVKEIGKGSFGEVYLCRDEITGQQYAMKTIPRDTSTKGGFQIGHDILREIAVMKSLRHENVVSLHEVIDDPSAKKLFIIQEYLEGGPLLPDAEVVEPIPIDLCRKYFRDILAGLCYLHAEGVIHRDIKPQNLLLSGDGVVKIADFGAAVFASANEKAALGGTPAFMAPELCMPDEKNPLVDVSRSPAIDVFALGATLYCMIFGRPPWMANNPIDLATKMRNIELTFPDDTVEPHLKHLLRRLLEKDYRTRITLDEVIQDDWVTNEGSEPLFVEDTMDMDDDDESNDENGRENIRESEIEEYVLDTQNASTVPKVQLPNIETRFDDSPKKSPTIDGKKHKKILVVDDRTVITKIMTKQIRELGAKCKSVQTGEEAVDDIRQSIELNSSYDIIFCDYLMPGMNGGDTVAAIRALGYTGWIIGMSDYELSDAKLRDRGADVVLVKPIRLNTLSLIVNDVDDVNDIEPLLLELSQGGMDLQDAIYQKSNSLTTNNRKGELLSTVYSGDESDRCSLPRSGSANNLSSYSLDVGSIASGDRGMERFVPDMIFPYHRDSLIEDFSSDIRMHPSLPEFTDELESESKKERKLVRTQEFKLVPSDIAFADDGRRIQKTIAVVGQEMTRLPTWKEQEVNRKAKRDEALKRSKMIQQKLDKSMKKNKTSMPSLMKEPSPMMLRPQTNNNRKIALEISLKTIESKSSDSSSEDNNVCDNSEILLGPVDYVSSNENSKKSTASSSTIMSNLLHMEIEDASSDDSDEDIVYLDDVGMENIFSAAVADSTLNRLLDKFHRLSVQTSVHLPETIRSVHHVNANLDIKYSHSEDLGSREYMEDRTSCHVSINLPHFSCHGSDKSLIKGDSPSESPTMAYMAVFDGHNGHYVADLLKHQFHHVLIEQIKMECERALLSVPTRHKSVTFHHMVKQALRHSCVIMDDSILVEDSLRRRKSLEDGTIMMQKFAGSVGVMMTAYVDFVITEHNQEVCKSDTQKLHIAIASIGDCRAVISKKHGQEALQLTTDHKPSIASERARIESAGGWVHNNRVNGVLAVSRSFGDLPYKIKEEVITRSQSSKFDLDTPHTVESSLSTPNTLSSSATSAVHSTVAHSLTTQVICEPQIVDFIIEEGDEFIILASDGLWDIMSAKQAVDCVRYYLVHDNDLDMSALHLIDLAKRLGAVDNISAVVMLLPIHVTH